nr:MAG TPA: hypothetical protein [Caudoviricetes sp.]
MAILAVLSSIISFSSLIPLQRPRPWRSSKPGLISVAWDAFWFTFPVIGTDRGQVPSRCHHIVDAAPGQVPVAVVASAHNGLLFPVDQIFELFSRFESRGLRGFNLNRFVSAWVAAFAALAVAGFKSSKANNLDFIPLGEAVADNFEYSIDCFFSIFLSHAGFSCNSGNHIGFIHFWFLQYLIVINHFLTFF